jgi:hypothetical protein
VANGSSIQVAGDAMTIAWRTSQFDVIFEGIGFSNRNSDTILYEVMR